MRKTSFMMAVIAFSTTSLFMGCNIPAEKADTARENVAEAQRDLAFAKRELKIDLENFRKETEMQLTKNQDQITILRDNAASKKNELRAAYDAKITELAKTNAAMETRLKSFRSEKNDDWQTFKTEFNSDMGALGLAIKNLTVDNGN